jgi:hypothetical protein
MDRAIGVPFAVLLGALLSAILLGIVGELPFWSTSTAATSSAIAPGSTWLRGWPMDGHDPQRTSLSLVSLPPGRLPRTSLPAATDTDRRPA